MYVREEDLHDVKFLRGGSIAVILHYWKDLQQGPNL